METCFGVDELSLTTTAVDPVAVLTPVITIVAVSLFAFTNAAVANEEFGPDEIEYAGVPPLTKTFRASPVVTLTEFVDAFNVWLFCWEVVASSFEHPAMAATKQRAHKKSAIHRLPIRSSLLLNYR
jgi:hypothetical protein